MDLTAYYPVLIIVGVLLLFIVVIVGAFLVGKRKYNADHGIVKEKKVKEKKVKEKKEKKAGKEKSETDIKLSEKDAAAVAAFNKSQGEGADDDEEYETEVKALKEEAARNKKVIEGPIIIVDEKEPAEEEVIEWKPPAEEKKNAATAENMEQAAAVIPEKPSGNEWDDEDLELFEARTYAFDEETQSGYMKEKEQKTDSEEEDLSFVYRERREQTRNPADDEGVQVFETFEKEEPAPPKAEEPKINNSKYAYFDSVMEKDKAQNERAEWQPPQKRDGPSAAEDKSEEKPKKTMQYIELDLDEK